MKLYLDHASTSPILDESLKVMMDAYREAYANPSSAHSFGSDVEKRSKQAKKSILKNLWGKPDNLIITSGGTEANNQIIFSQSYKRAGNNSCFLTSSIEHKSVLMPLEYWVPKKSIYSLKVGDNGQISLEILEEILEKEGENLTFVSLMHVNNETGIIQPLEKAAEIIRKKSPEAFIHVDGVQAFGKIHIQPLLGHIDAYSISAHKVKGPRGLGALWIKNPTKINPLLRGGNQEYGKRAGTENIPGLLGFEKSVLKAYKNLEKNHQSLLEIRKNIIEEIKNRISDVMVIESKDQQVPGIILLAFENIKSEVLLHSLESEGIYVSSGSACTARKDEISHVLIAMGIPRQWAEGVLRISFDEMLTSDQILYLVEKLSDHIQKIRKWTKR